MNLRPTFIEFAAVVGFFILGVLLRTVHLEREAVEHFDEGIYASPLWYDGQFNEPYPSRHLFAPPLISTMMEGFSWVPGLAQYAPFLPSALLGIATIPGLWWLARSWFGKPAGIFIVAVAAMSDFHIIYSRMALTDVACLFWIIASVSLGTLAVARQSFRTAAIAGFVCGLAWWTKYTTACHPVQRERTLVVVAGSQVFAIAAAHGNSGHHNRGCCRDLCTVVVATSGRRRLPDRLEDSCFICYGLVVMDHESDSAAPRPVSL
jgi:hypothetical protein